MRLGVEAALVDGTLVPGDVDVADGVIGAVGVGGGGGSGVAVPGFVDLQVNGFGGVEFRHGDAAGYAVAAEALARHGAVAVQPTFFSCSVDEYRVALGELAGVHAAPPSGAAFLAAHLEGPFLSPTWAGAHRVEDFLAPDARVADTLLAAGPVGFMTVAPELDGGIELVAHLVAAGIVVSVGHSDATAEQVRAAVHAGARHLTHCWNAHRRLTSRDPGPAGVALTDPRVTVGLIADLVHTAPETVLLTVAAAESRVAVTTDAIPPAGTGLASWSEHGREVRIVDGAARLDDGTLAGSVATPDGLLRTLVGLGVELPVAVDACGGVQRRLLGLPECRVRPGDPADLVVLDRDLRPVRTLVAGREAFAA
jgi:N-acetylglucosamine-6-phosphate deacetylase